MTLTEQVLRFQKRENKIKQAEPSYEEKFLMVAWGGFESKFVVSSSPISLVKIGAEFGAKLDNILFLSILIGLVYGKRLKFSIFGQSSLTAD